MHKHSRISVFGIINVKDFFCCWLGGKVVKSLGVKERKIIITPGRHNSSVESQFYCILRRRFAVTTYACMSIKAEVEDENKNFLMIETDSHFMSTIFFLQNLDIYLRTSKIKITIIKVIIFILYYRLHTLEIHS